MGERARITVARFAGGVTIRVEGPGRMSESRVVHAFAEQAIAENRQQVLIDLSACSYLDSTFLGGLVSLHKRHGTPPAEAAGEPAHFAIYAPPEQRRLLFSVSRLDQLLPFADQLPATQSEQDLALDVDPLASKEDLIRYVVDCHRKLAELGGAEAPEFRRVADALESELHKPTPRRSTDG